MSEASLRLHHPARHRYPVRSICLCLSTIILASGCGKGQSDKWGASVESARDIGELDPSRTTSVRARGLPDKDIPSLALLPNLEYLDFCGGWKQYEAKTTDSGLRALSHLELPHLKSLILGFTDRVTDTGIKDVAQIGTLRILGLLNCPKVTNQGLSEVVRMSSLERLDLRASPWITDESLSILEHGKGLKTILLNGCKNYSVSALTHLQKALPECRILTEDDNDPTR